MATASKTVLQHGTFLAQRWEADDGGVNLYHCTDEGRGFFIEVGVDDGLGQAVVLRSFVSSVPLVDYSYWVWLPNDSTRVESTNQDE